MSSFSISNYNALLGVWTLYKRECWRFLKVWSQTLLAPCVTSLLFLAILNLALGRAGREVDGLPYNQFIVPGLIMMAVVQNSFANSSSSLMLSKIQGVIIDLLMPPFKGGELAFSIAMGGVTRGMIVALICAFALYMFVPFTMHSFGWALYFLFISSVLLALLGCLSGIVAQNFDQMSSIINYVITPLAFLSGTFYSIKNLPPFWQKVSHADPFFYMIDGFRYSMTGHSDGDIVLGAVTLFIITLVMAVVVRHVFVKGWRLKT